MTESGGHTETAEVSDRVARRRIPKITLALSAFVMSVTIALINAFYSVRGAEVIVLPPKNILLYRDGAAEASVIVAALPTSIINAADSNHGDVLLDAHLKYGSGTFEWMSDVVPSFRAAEMSRPTCPADARCVFHMGLMIVEHDNQIVSLPGGDAKSQTLAFPIDASNCTGKSEACAAFDGQELALKGFKGRQAHFSFVLRLYDDGNREVDCTTAQIPLPYLRKVGWVSLPCVRASVRNDRWF